VHAHQAVTGRRLLTQDVVALARDRTLRQEASGDRREARLEHRLPGPLVPHPAAANRLRSHAPVPEPFEQSYWTEDSQYRKFEDYPQALEALRDWYQGLLRLVDDDLPPPGRHLDAGCGHGAIVHELLARGFDAHGFDISRWMVEQAQRFRPETAERFQAGDFDAIPFDGHFDLITCLEVLEHVTEPADALGALRARLRPGGRLIATTPNLHPRIPWWDPVAADPTHVSVHEPGWWRQAATAAGLEPRRVSTYVSVPVLWRLHPRLARRIPFGRRAGPEVLLVADAPG
jgi:SAM-dependent methyltransferase